MDALIEPLVGLVERHGAWAAPVAGLLAFGESLAVVGVLVPGALMLVAMGGLAGSGLVAPGPVIVAAIIGAALGDILSYLAGAWIGPRVLRHWPLNRHRRSVARVRLFFRRFGVATVFLGRFFGPLRSIAPLVAGATGMGWWRFQLANVASAVIWAPAALAPGWLIAKGTASFVELGEVDWILGVAVVGAALAVAAGLAALAVARRRRTVAAQGDGRRRVPAA
jgi:membrane protein DedA with SNARE-associated domain